MQPFTEATFRWFAGIEENNAQAWFDENRETYDRDVKGALESIFEALLPRFPGIIKLQKTRNPRQRTVAGFENKWWAILDSNQ